MVDEEFFLPEMKAPKAQFIKSLTDLRDCPMPRLTEIAVVGRSNVGKSSLINVLFNQRHLAKTSSTPGKTRLINYFQIENQYYLVDLPGYGYAKAPRSESDKWKIMIERYLKNSPALRFVFQLVDIRHGIMKSDRLMVDWLDAFGINYAFVLTKSDKLSKNELSKQIRKIALEAGARKIFPFSSKNRQGRDALLEEINLICASNIAMDGA